MQIKKEWLRGIMANVLSCNLEDSQFEIYARFNVHFRTNTLGKGMNPLITLAMCLNSMIEVVPQECLSH